MYSTLISFLLLIVPFPAWGTIVYDIERTSQSIPPEKWEAIVYNNKTDNQNIVASGTEETSFEGPSQYKEKTRIAWKVGLSKNWNLENSKDSLSQIPVTGELHFSLSPQSKWLLQAGGGLMVKTKRETICDPFFIPDAPKPPFDDEFFQQAHKKALERTTNLDTCFKKQKSDHKLSPYFTAQTGFKYGSGIYGALQGGVIFSIKGDMGWTGELLIGRDTGLDASIGLQITSFEDSKYIGLVLYFGNAIKSWWAEE